jgi:large subunit ribosomal protein L4
MLQIPVHRQTGEQVGQVEIDEAVFGGSVRKSLLKQAIVMHLANRRLGAAATRSRSMVQGSTRKLYAQKHTGRARAGTVRSPIRRGGGVAHAKRPHSYRQRMPAKARRRALDSALLAKLQGGDAVVLEALDLPEIKTKAFVEVLGNLKIFETIAQDAGKRRVRHPETGRRCETINRQVRRSCLVVLEAPSEVIWKSARNVPGVTVSSVGELFAYGVAAPRKMLITRKALDALVEARSGAVKAAADALETT